MENRTKITQEEKGLLLKDLCARLLYGIIVSCRGGDRKLSIDYIKDNKIYIVEYPQPTYDIEEIKPYLRSMSSMTEEERIEYKHLVSFSGNPSGSANFIDWLNAHHFDFRGLIPKGLALEATEGMYNLKQK